MPVEAEQGQAALALGPLGDYRVDPAFPEEPVEPKIEMPIEVYFKENVPEDYTFSSYQILTK
ncbi:hypothetical protein FACS189496_4580 [Bacilli bacterium]|nr:hypothetical protein FACS189496_4580 [Bacilli bacterium]